MTESPASYASLVASEIRAEMGRQRKTTAELAAVLRCSPGTANNRLADAYPFNLDELYAVCQWLGKPLADITGAAESQLKAAS
ncbi:hypothetical protein C5E45_32790 [Nocardia nova]|uniref:XRE family transcriptional regulator n=1 Tax=Nocardia nova TaxID=37330 RepID=A0A2S6ACU4_9NOCA|nr:hypothetical protein [Nocardia nova]PPJ31869.1 hypothetical protein C5E45_32790 [Nocardia nova]